MKDKEMLGKARLKEALEQSDLSYLEKHPPVEEEIRYSENYRKKIDRLTQRKKSTFFIFFNAVGKRTVGFAAILLIVFTCAMTVSAVREPVIELIETVSDSIYRQLGVESPDLQGSEIEAEPHAEHDFSVLIKTDGSKHYYACNKKGCKEEYVEFHHYVHKPGTHHLECEVCGRRPK